jgi:hypothetical protein
MVGVAAHILASVLAVQPTSSQPLYIAEADVLRTIESAWQVFEPCEALVVEGSPAPEPVTASFVIGRDGVVSNAELAEPEELASEYSSCLVQQLSTIGFPEHWENPIALRYVFTWGTQGLIKYPRVPLPLRHSFPLGLGFFGLSTGGLYDLLFEADTGNATIE